MNEDKMMACRTRIFVGDMTKLHEALTSGDFPTEGLSEFIDIDTSARTVLLRGSVAAVGAAWRFLDQHGVM